MVVYNYSGGEINAKIVYYGPGLSGKTTNLEYIYSKMPVRVKGKMVSMKTRTDRTLFFDFLPLELGSLNGYKIRFLLYTVPGQVYYNATRKLVLKGADAVVFVADSSPSKIDENIESLRNLEENLNEHELTLDTIPWLMQYNKRDLDDAMPVSELNERLNVLNVPTFEAVATEGIGVYETFQTVARLLYEDIKKNVDEKGAQDTETQQTASEPETIEAVPSPPPTGQPETIEITSPPAAGQSEAVGQAEDQEFVSEVVDSALREVEQITEPVVRPAIPEPSVPPANINTAPNEQRVSEPPSMRVEKEEATSHNSAPAGGEGSGSGEPGEPQEFKFAPMEEAPIDNQVGRVVDLETQAGSPGADQKESGFITDPCRSSTAATQTVTKQEKQAEADGPDRSEPQTQCETATDIKVPVVISRSQVKKNIPLKLILEIQVIDD